MGVEFPVAVMLEIFKQWGSVGVVVFILLWDKMVWPYIKKKRGNWIHYGVIDERIKGLEKRFEDEKTHNYNQHAEIFKILRELEKK